MTASAADAGLASSYFANERPPPIRIRYFYASQLALDDPLSPVPAPATATAANRTPPIPLSQLDSDAIEKAWIELRSKFKSYEEELVKQEKQRLKDVTPPQSSPALRASRTSRADSFSRDRSGSKRSSRVFEDVRRDAPVSASPGSGRRGTLSSSEGRHIAYLDELDSANTSKTGINVEASFDIGESTQGTTGTPFVRVPKRTRTSNPYKGSKSDASPSTPTSDSRRTSIAQPASAAESVFGATARLTPPSAQIPVGISRLHEVKLPSLQYVTDRILLR